MYESYTMGAFKLNKATLLAERLNVIGEGEPTRFYKEEPITRRVG